MAAAAQARVPVAVAAHPAWAVLEAAVAGAVLAEEVEVLAAVAVAAVAVAVAEVAVAVAEGGNER